MPQMMPLSWVTLFLITIFIMMKMMTMSPPLFFGFPKQQKISSKKNKMSW